MAILLTSGPGVRTLSLIKGTGEHRNNMVLEGLEVLVYMIVVDQQLHSSVCERGQRTDICCGG